MKKILTAILAASLLMMLILPAAVQAEQQEEVPAESGVLFELGNGLSSLLDKDGPLVGLFSEGGSLSSVVPEGIDVEKTAEELSKELSNPSSALYQAAAGVVEAFWMKKAIWICRKPLIWPWGFLEMKKRFLRSKKKAIWLRML